MNHPDLAPHPFVLPELVSDRTAYVKDFIKAKTDLDMRTNLAALIDITRDDYDLSQHISAAFRTAELLTKQEELFNLLISEAVKHGIYEAVYQLNNSRQTSQVLIPENDTIIRTDTNCLCHTQRQTETKNNTNRLNPIITSRELCALLFPHAAKLDAEFANLDRSYHSGTRTLDIHFPPTPPNSAANLS
jgi:hypothetical protein